MYLIFEHEIKPIWCSLVDIINTGYQFSLITLEILPSDNNYIANAMRDNNICYVVLDDGRTGAKLSNLAIISPHLAKSIISNQSDIYDCLRQKYRELMQSKINAESNHDHDWSHIVRFETTFDVGRLDDPVESEPAYVPAGTTWTPIRNMRFFTSETPFHFHYDEL